MPPNSESIPEKKIEHYYDRSPAYEWERLERHPMELAITQRAIQEYGPAAPASVFDCGGGPGRYAIWLAQLGYSVTLLDLSAENLHIAQAQSVDAGVELVKVLHGTATDLSQIDDEQFDMVLLLGPLYHLMERSAQIRAIEEAKRVLGKGGILFAAFLNRFSLVRYVARYQPGLVLQDQEIIDSVLSTGDARSHKYPNAFSSYSYWAHPGEIEPLMAECGLEKICHFSAEGGLAYLDDEMGNLEEAEWNAWVDVNYRLAKEPEILGSGIHLIYVGRK